MIEILHSGGDLFEPVKNSILSEELSGIEKKEANDKIISENEIMCLLNTTKTKRKRSKKFFNEITEI